MGFLTARKNAGLSQAAVARALGIAPESVCQWETGKTFPNPRKLPVIAALYNCSIDELMQPDEEECRTVSES